MKVSIRNLANDSYQELEIHKTPFIIGRGGSCDVVIDHDSISRQHCKVELVNGEFLITDLNSKNGVILDEKKLEPRKPTVYHSFLVFMLGVTEVQVTL